VHNQQAFGLAYGILHNVADAEDELQNARLLAWQYRRERRGTGETFNPWFRRILINRCFARLAERRRAALVSCEGKLFGKPLVDRAALPEARHGAAEVTRIVRREVRALPPRWRAVVVLRDLEQLATSDIAHQFGVPEQVVKNRLFQGRKELRRRMGKHFGRRGLGTLI
jgi:RNA polymerase sigma-70 factor (ECF subfamily)